MWLLSGRRETSDGEKEDDELRHRARAVPGKPRGSALPSGRRVQAAGRWPSAGHSRRVHVDVFVVPPS